MSICFSISQIHYIAYHYFSSFSDFTYTFFHFLSKITFFRIFFFSFKKKDLKKYHASPRKKWKFLVNLLINSICLTDEGETCQIDTQLRKNENLSWVYLQQSLYPIYKGETLLWWQITEKKGKFLASLTSFLYLIYEGKTQP